MAGREERKGRGKVWRMGAKAGTGKGANKVKSSVEQNEGMGGGREGAGCWGGVEESIGEGTGGAGRGREK